MPANAPLPSDPRRQADRTIRAYVYQVWQSVYAWTALKEDETLYLEGAEDFDIVGPAASVATQVKDSPRRVSLRSAEIQEALSNAWRLFVAAPTRNIQYRFLTRGEAGVESGNPFGKGVAGLKLWREASVDPQRVRPLARFLCKLTDLHPDLRAFLRSADDEQLSKRFFSRVHWDTASPEDDFVEHAVEHQLALLGEKLRVGYTEATAAKDRLFTVACRVAKSPTHRTLMRVDLLREFGEATRVSMSHAEASGLREASQLIGPLLRQLQPALGAMLSFDGTLPLETIVPPLPATIAEREALVAQLSTTIRKTGSLVLHGSTGMGKTTLAKLALAYVGGDWLWIGFSGRSTAEARRLMLECARRVSASVGPVSVVFDDVDFSPSAARDVEAEIGGLLYQLRENRGAMILTSQKSPPLRLLTGCGIDNASVQVVPSLDIEEITLLIERMGCPAHANPARWAQLCKLTTRGHPQLVQAYAIGLREREWPQAQGEVLFQPSVAVAEEKTQARQLVDALPEPLREMLFRLTVIGGAFRRDQALALGAKVPELSRPGEVFDRLAGPWIEPLSTNYYRVSPLLEKAGESVFSPERLRELRIGIIEALRVCEPVTVLEAGIAFQQAWEARSDWHIAALLGSFFSAPHRAKRSLAQHLDWFVAEGLRAGEVLLPQHRLLSRMLRCLQLALAPDVFPRLIPKILEAWHHETHGSDANAEAVEKCVLAAHALTQIAVPLSIPRMFSYLRDIEAVERGEDQFAKALVNARDALPRRMAARGNAMSGILSRFIISRCRTPEMLEELLCALAAEPQDFRARILAAWTTIPFDARSLIDGVWLKLSKEKNPDWQRCLTAFQRAYEFGGMWSAPDLSIAAIRASTIVLNEALHDPDKALAQLEERAAAQSLQSELLDDARATVHFNHHRDDQALACWERALGAWPPAEEVEDRSASFAARMAGRAAGRLGLWHKAAEHFIGAHRRLKTRRGREYAAGLLADAGFAYWRAGDRVRALDNLIASMRSIELLPHGKDNLLAFRLRKVLGHIIIWIHHTEQGHDTDIMNEPQPGMCSELEAHPGFRDLPENDHQLVWLLLARLQCTMGLDSDLHDEVIAKVKESTAIGVLVLLSEYRILRSLQRRQFAALPRLGHEFARVMRAGMAADSEMRCLSEGLTPATAVSFRVDDSVTGGGLLIAGLVIHGAKEEPFSNCFALWRAVAAELPPEPELREWLDSAEALLCSDSELAAQALNSDQVKWFDLLIAALNVASAPIVTPRNLVLAHFRLLDLLADTPWFLACGPALLQLFTGGWLRASLNSSDLNFPDLSVPSVRSTFDNSAYWISKATEIVVVGARVTGIRIPPPMHPRIKAMLDGKLQHIKRKSAA